MKEGIQLKLQARTSKYLEKNIPLLKLLCAKADERPGNDKRETQENKKPIKKPKQSVKASFDAFLPPRGPLVDIHGPGTVFHHIKLQDAARKRREDKRKKVFGDKKATVRNSGPQPIRPPPPAEPEV